MAKVVVNAGLPPFHNYFTFRNKTTQHKTNKKTNATPEDGLNLPLGCLDDKIRRESPHFTSVKVLIDSLKWTQIYLPPSFVMSFVGFSFTLVSRFTNC